MTARAEAFQPGHLTWRTMALRRHWARHQNNIDAKEWFLHKPKVVSRRSTQKSNQHIQVPIQLPLTPCGATDTSCLCGSNSRTPAV